MKETNLQENLKEKTMTNKLKKEELKSILNYLLGGLIGITYIEINLLFIL